MPQRGSPLRRLVWPVALCLAARLAVVEPGVAQVRLDQEREAMGTPFRIVACVGDSATGLRGLEAAWARIDAIERALSDYDPDSEVSNLARSEARSTARVSDDLATALALADGWWRRSDGAYDAALGALTRIWRRAVRRNELPPDAEILSARTSSGWPLVDRSRDGRSVRFLVGGVRLDFGGIGKGWAADEVLAVLARHGIRSAVVDAGGDVTASDAPPDRPGWLIELAPIPGADRWVEPGGESGRGIANGWGGDRDSNLRYLANASVATSGATWRNVESDGVRYSHILDPMTGSGVKGRRIVTVYADRGADADALATALSVLDVDRAIRLGGREAMGARMEEESVGIVVVGRLPDRAPPDARPSECRSSPAVQRMRGAPETGR